MSTDVGTGIGRFVWHDHVSNEPEKALSFYMDLLGWETELWRAGGSEYPMIKTHEQTHGGFGPAQDGAPAHWLGHIAVESADNAAERAEAAGGTVVAAPMDIPEVGRAAVIGDPQGAVFSVFAPRGESPTSEGVFVWDELLTSDVEGAKQFYGAVVGWTTADMDMGEMGVYRIFSSGDAQRAGCMPLPDGMEAPPHWLTYVGSEDVDASTAKAEGLGGLNLMGPMDVADVGRLAILADPTGAVLGLFERSEAGS